MQADRRERDSQAIKAFDAGVAAISEDMEQRVLEASYALRDSLGAADDAIAATRKELDVDDLLVQGDMAYVEVREVLEASTCYFKYHVCGTSSPATLGRGEVAEYVATRRRTMCGGRE